MRVSAPSSSFFLSLRIALIPGGLLVGGAALTGCGGSDRVPVHPVQGQVLFEGKPAPHAHVVLHPVGPADKTPPPQGQVGPDGSFRVGTYQPGDGAPAGEYAVTVQWLLTSAQNPDAPASNRLPVRYSQASTSGLRVQVREGDNRLPTLQLKK
jgi:hypothetical protein